MAYIVDIAEKVSKDAGALDSILDPLYCAGYMTKDTLAPSADKLVSDFSRTYGTSPAYLIVDRNANGDGVISLATYDSHVARKFLAYAQILSFEQAEKKFASGNID